MTHTHAYETSGLPVYDPLAREAFRLGWHAALRAMRQRLPLPDLDPALAPPTPRPVPLATPETP